MIRVLWAIGLLFATSARGMDPTKAEVRSAIQQLTPDFADYRIRWLLPALSVGDAGARRWFFNMDVPESGAELWETDALTYARIVKDIGQLGEIISRAMGRLLRDRLFRSHVHRA